MNRRGFLGFIATLPVLAPLAASAASCAPEPRRGQLPPSGGRLWDGTVGPPGSGARFPTIAAALDAAPHSGGTIYVLPGHAEAFTALPVSSTRIIGV